jgi:hypothetical protein
MANTYDQGDMVRLAATFEIETVDTDPSTITFKILAPDGTVTTYVFGTDVQLERDAAGAYHVDWSVTKVGTYHYRFEGTGTAQAAQEGYFYVNKSVFS